MFYVQINVKCWENWLSCIRLSKKEAIYVLGVIQNFYSGWLWKLKQQKNFFDSRKNIKDKLITKFSKDGFYRKKKKNRPDFLLVSSKLGNHLINLKPQKDFLKGFLRLIS